MREISLFQALEDGEFADVKRPTRSAGAASRASFKTREPDYFNPFFAALREGRLSGPPTGPAPGESVRASQEVAS